MPPPAPSLRARVTTRLFRETLDRVVPDSIYVARRTLTAPRVALTLDDGPDDLTESYLTLFNKYDVKATFCVIGKLAAERPKEIQSMLAQGHQVISHGYTHTVFPKLSRDGLSRELSLTSSLLAPEDQRYVRPPQGAMNLRSLVRLGLLGYSVVHWSLDSDDCRTEDPARVAKRIESSRPGEIVLLHEGQKWTLEALERALPAMKARGYTFVTVRDLLQ